MKKFSSSLVLCTGLLAFACGAPSGGPEGDNEPDKDGTGGGSGGNLDVGLDATRKMAAQTCESSQVGPRLLRRLTRPETQAVISAVFPEVLGDTAWKGVRLSADPESAQGFSNSATVLTATGPVVRDLLKTAENLADIISSDALLPSLFSCADAGDSACAEEIINSYGHRLFRRPLSDDDRARYLELFSSVSAESDFNTGIKWTLVALLQSPYTFYRSELGVDDGEGNFMLTQHELATNLAFTFTGGPPSAELLARADAGELGDPAAEAEALLALDAKVTIRGFFSEWLDYQRIRGEARDAYPNFATSVSDAMAEETQIFTETMATGSYTVHDLMKSDWTVLNQALVDHYGFGQDELDAAGGDWAMVPRPADTGVGIMAMGAILSTNSHQTHTSPTLRGLHFYERFLCEDRPHPPDIVPPLEETAGQVDEATTTTREKYELHHAKGFCADCHVDFEPFGFTFESFDEAGVYRATEKGKPIDTQADVVFGGESISVENMNELAQLMGPPAADDAQNDIENCVSGLMAAYFTSGAGGTSCLAEEARRRFAAGEISIRQYLVEIAASKHFSQRR